VSECLALLEQARERNLVQFGENAMEAGEFHLQLLRLLL